MPSSQPAAGYLAVQPQFLSSQPSPMAKVSEPNRSRSYDPKKPHITDSPITKSNWYKHVNWLNVTLIVGIPIYGCVQAFWVPLQWRTALFAVLYYFMTGLGITAGKLSTSNAIDQRLNILKAIIGCGRTHLTLQLYHSECFWLLWAVEPSKDQSDGGLETIELITAIPTPIRIHIPSARVYYTRISAGW